MCSWLVGERSPESAFAFIADLTERLSNRVQITADGFGPYPEAILGYPTQRWGLIVDDDVGHQDAGDDRVYLGLPGAQGLQRIWSDCLDGHDEHVRVRFTTN